MKSLPRLFKTCLDWLLFVPSVQNPDERRRREILARIVLFMLLILGGELLEGILQYPLSQILSGDFLREIWGQEESRILFSGSVIGLVGISLTWLLNRQHLGRFGWLPGAALLAAITGLVSIFDTPIQIIDVAKKPTTNWPGLMCRTSRPTSFTMPTYSCPIGVGWTVDAMP